MIRLGCIHAPYYYKSMPLKIQGEVVQRWLNMTDYGKHLKRKTSASINWSKIMELIKHSFTDFGKIWLWKHSFWTTSVKFSIAELKILWNTFLMKMNKKQYLSQALVLFLFFLSKKRAMRPLQQRGRQPWLLYRIVSFSCFFFLSIFKIVSTVCRAIR